MRIGTKRGKQAVIRIREETTLAELREVARARTHKRLSLPKGVLTRTAQVGRDLAEMLEKGNLEPHEAAALLGEIFNSAMEAAVLLKLDPAGCIALAHQHREPIPA